MHHETRRVRLRAAPIALLLAALAASLPAAAAVGTVGITSGPFTATMTAQGCGRERTTFRMAITLKKGHTWRATGDGDVFTGRFTENATRTVLTLTMDANSRAVMIRNLRSWATHMCGLPVSVSSVSAAKVVLRLNSRHTLATGTLLVTATGSTSAGRGRASYSATYSGGFNGN